MTVYGHDGRVIEPFTAERAQEEAQGAAAGWMTGWTGRSEDRPGEPQRCINYVGGGTDGQGDYFEVMVEAARHVDEPDRRFRIRVTAEELPAGG